MVVIGIVVGPVFAQSNQQTPAEDAPIAAAASSNQQVRPLAKIQHAKTPPIKNSFTEKPAQSIEQIVRNAARKYGINEEYFVRIARCESTMNPNAVNRNYYDHGHPSGLFQHISGYWPARAAKHGYAGASVFDAEANASVTAAMFASGQSSLWECK